MDKDTVLLAQDWQAAVSDIEVVKEMGWLMESYVHFFNNYNCLNAQSITVKYMIMNINFCNVLLTLIITFRKKIRYW